MMIFGIILGAICGFGAVYVVAPLKELVGSRVELSEQESGILAFGAVLLAAAIVGAIVAGGVGAFWLVLGGLLGVFGLRIIEFAKVKFGEMSSAKDKTVDVVDEVSDKLDAVKEDVADAVSDKK